MQEITHVLADFKGLSRDQFLAARPEPVLLHKTNPGGKDSEQSFVAGLKRKQRPTVLTADPLLEVETARSESGLLVFPVRSGSDSADPTQITVGRAPDCDIQLPYDKVSWRHAYFLCSDDRRMWFVSDTGSTNGTFLNGLELPAETPSKIYSGSVVKFATAEFTFHLAGDFHDYLTRLMAKIRKDP